MWKRSSKKFKLSRTEKYALKRLSEIGIHNTPVYRNGTLMYIDEIDRESTYDNRGYAYNARIFISDEVVYNLDDCESIDSIIIPDFECNKYNDNDLVVVYDFSYIMKMNACAEKNPELAVSQVFKTYELMKASLINWSYKDYNRLVEQLWKVNKIKHADYLENLISEDLMSDNAKIKLENLKNALNEAKELGYDLLLSSSHFGTCEECAKFQSRVYSISGKSKYFPPLPENVYKYGGFHKGCRHTFSPFFYYEGAEISIYSNNERNLLSVDAVEYSNRPYVDNRSIENRMAYEKAKTHTNSLNLREQLKREYYHKRFYDPDSVPKSLSAFLKEKEYKYIK